MSRLTTLKALAPRAGRRGLPDAAALLAAELWQGAFCPAGSVLETPNTAHKSVR